jgi:hypothetical protein
MFVNVRYEWAIIDVTLSLTTMKTLLILRNDINRLRFSYLCMREHVANQATPVDVHQRQPLWKEHRMALYLVAMWGPDVEKKQTHGMTLWRRMCAYSLVTDHFQGRTQHNSTVPGTIEPLS